MVFFCFSRTADSSSHVLRGAWTGATTDCTAGAATGAAIGAAAGEAGSTETGAGAATPSVWP